MKYNFKVVCVCMCHSMASNIFAQFILIALYLDWSYPLLLSASSVCNLESCSVGTEYCDQNEGRCSPCSHALCQLSPIPPSCQQICKVLKAERTKVQRDDRRDECVTVSDHSTLQYVTVVQTSVTLLIIIALVICLNRRQCTTSHPTRKSHDITELALKSQPGGSVVENVESHYPSGETVWRTNNQINESRNVCLDFIPLAQTHTPSHCVCEEVGSGVRAQPEIQQESIRTASVNQGSYQTSDRRDIGRTTETTNGPTQQPPGDEQAQVTSQPLPMSSIHKSNRDLASSLRQQSQTAAVALQTERSSINPTSLQFIPCLSGQLHSSVQNSDTSPKLLDNFDSSHDDVYNLDTTYVKSTDGL